jgi:hypothetical protein
VSISAGSITVSQTLLLLDTEHTTFAEGVADGRYMFWLGSGISLGVVPGLHGVVLKVLKHLPSRMTPGRPQASTPTRRSAWTSMLPSKVGRTVTRSLNA